MFKPLNQQSQVLFFLFLSVDGTENLLIGFWLFMHSDSCLIATAFCMMKSVITCTLKSLFHRRAIHLCLISLICGWITWWRQGFHQEACSGTLETEAARINVPNGQLDPGSSYIFVFKINFKLSCNIGYNKYITNEYNII